MLLGVVGFRVPGLTTHDLIADQQWEAVVKSFPGARYRRILVADAAALALPLAALAATSSGAGAPSGAAGQSAATTARTTADTAACPWLNQSLPVAQRVSMLMAQM